MNLRRLSGTGQLEGHIRGRIVAVHDHRLKGGPFGDSAGEIGRIEGCAVDIPEFCGLRIQRRSLRRKRK